MKCNRGIFSVFAFMVALAMVLMSCSEETDKMRTETDDSLTGAEVFDKAEAKKTILHMVGDKDSLVFDVIEEFRDYSISNSDDEAYWYSYYQEVSALIELGRKSEARLRAYDMQEQLEANPSDIGWAYQHVIMGVLNMRNTDYGFAIDELNQALEIGIDEHYIMARALSTLARCYYGLDMPEEALEALEKCRGKLDSARQKGDMAALECLSYAYLEDIENFTQAYEQFKTHKKVNKSDSLFVEAYADFYLRGVEPDMEAISASIVPIKVMKLNYLISRAKHDYKAALVSMEDFYRVQKTAVSQAALNDVALVQQVAAAQRTEVENARLKSQTQERTISLIMLVVIVIIVAFILILFFMRNANRKVLEANQAKTNFVQNISHDVRTPLNAVVGFSQLLALPQEFNTDEERRSYAEFITTNAQLLTILIDDMLSISDVAHNNLNVTMGLSSANKVGKQAIQTCEHRCQPGVVMSYESEVGDDYHFTTDSNRLLQVLINLLSNATKNTTEGSIILKCSLSETPGKITFSVTDTGCGVPEEMQDSIFQRFVKLDNSKQGSGLGLNICTEIAAKLGGEVKLDKEYTGGARFVLILPIENQ